jgi:hypothetical protein
VSVVAGRAQKVDHIPALHILAIIDDFDLGYIVLLAVA